MTSKTKAESNLKVYFLIKIFTKRAYLPLIPIYFNQIVGMTIQEIGYLGAFAGLCRLILEIPTGYFSDKVSRRLSVFMTGVMGLVGVAILIFVQSKTGMYMAVAFESVAYTFASGNTNALLHDSLVTLKREKEFIPYSSKVQSHSLLINAVLIAIVPLTYVIKPTLPFAFGLIQFGAIFVGGFFTYDLAVSRKKIKKPNLKLKLLNHHKQFLSFAVILGIFSAVYLATSDFEDIATVEFGMPPEFMGWIYAGASLGAAIFGRYIGRIKNMPVLPYVVTDSIILILSMFVYYFENVPLLVVAFIVSMSFWRNRNIVYEGFILDKFKPKNTGTMLSTVTNISQLNGVWMPIVAGILIEGLGIANGFVAIGIFAMVVSIIFVPVAVRTFK